MIYIHVPSLPLSVNAAYAKKRGSGARILTKEGRRYKTETSSFIARQYPVALKFFKPDVPYALVVEFTFPSRSDLYCETWGQPKGADSRYKSLDVSNRLKLFEDALASATGVDDKHNFVMLLNKTWIEGQASTDVWVWNREEEPRNPLDELLQCLRQAQPHRAVPELPGGWVQGSTKSHA